ncbi:MAG: aminotransferase class I/II-fold pyridoxal phosphate-dependent enzyme [Polyangiaceae bacterium]
MAELRSRLAKRDGLAYICSPNNPTGNRLIDRSALEPLLSEFPRSFFFIDEAYVDYLEPSRQPKLADLTERHQNLLVLRSFSFAHGLAGAHVGYAITNPELVKAMTARATPHVVGRLSAELAAASLADADHLANVRAEIARGRAQLTLGMRELSGIDVFDSETNFIYARLHPGRSAADLAQALRARGLLIKTFEPVGDTRFDEYCRFTVGLPEENALLLEQLEAELAERSSPSLRRPGAALDGHAAL